MTAGFYDELVKIAKEESKKKKKDPFAAATHAVSHQLEEAAEKGIKQLPHTRWGKRLIGLKRVARGLLKGSSYIDDLEAPPSQSLMPALRAAHGLGKSSSWADIHVGGRPEKSQGWKPVDPPFKLASAAARALELELDKEAGRLRNLYNAAYVGATELAHNPAAHAAAKGVASGMMRGNPVRAAGGIAEGVARSEAGAKLLKAVKKKAKSGLQAAREAVYPTGPGGKLVYAAYKLQGQTSVQGIPLAIENRKGSVRKGTDSDGNEWRTKMRHPYGYIKGTKGADGEEVDAYVGPDKGAPAAFVVHQRDKETGKYDEDKVMLGFSSKAAAKAAFLAHYDSPKFLGPISRVSMERLRDLVASKRRLVQIHE